MAEPFLPIYFPLIQYNVSIIIDNWLNLLCMGKLGSVAHILEYVRT